MNLRILLGTLCLCAAVMPQNSFAAGGLNASGNVLPVGAGGVTVMTITGSSLQTDFAGPVTTKDIAVMGNESVSGTIASNAVATKNLSVTGPAAITGDTTINGSATIGTAASHKILTVNGGIAIMGKVNKGTGCTPDGLVAQDAATSGALLSCQSGIWKSAMTASPTSVTKVIGSGYIGEYDFCTLSRVSNVEDSHYCQVYKGAGRSWYAASYKCYGMQVACLSF